LCSEQLSLEKKNYLNYIDENNFLIMYKVQIFRFYLFVTHIVKSIFTDKQMSSSRKIT